MYSIAELWMLPILGHVTSLSLSRLWATMHWRQTPLFTILTWLNIWYPRWWMSILGSCLIQELQPFLPISGIPRPLKSISGQPLNVYGRKLVELKLMVFQLWLQFYICDVPCSVLSVPRRLLQGYQVEPGRQNCSMTSPVGQRMTVTKHGSLLFICPATPKLVILTILRVVRMTLLLHHFLLHSKFHHFVTSLQMIGKQFFL